MQFLYAIISYWIACNFAHIGFAAPVTAAEKETKEPDESGVPDWCPLTNVICKQPGRLVAISKPCSARQSQKNECNGDRNRRGKAYLQTNTDDSVNLTSAFPLDENAIFCMTPIDDWVLRISTANGQSVDISEDGKLVIDSEERGRGNGTTFRITTIQYGNRSNAHMHRGLCAEREGINDSFIIGFDGRGRQVLEKAEGRCSDSTLHVVDRRLQVHDHTAFSWNWELLQNAKSLETDNCKMLLSDQVKSNCGLEKNCRKKSSRRQCPGD